MPKSWVWLQLLGAGRSRRIQPRAFLTWSGRSTWLAAKLWSLWQHGGSVPETKLGLWGEDDVLRHSLIPIDNQKVIVWDSEHYRPSEAYVYYCDSSRTGPIRWTAKQFDGGAFRLRMEGVHVDRGFVYRVKGVSRENLRTKADIARSSAEYFHACYVLSGSVAYEQADRINLARRGDLVLFDGGIPYKATSLASTDRSCTEILAVLFSKSVSAFSERCFANVHCSREKLMAPLASIFSYASNRLVWSSHQELNALVDAAINLLAISVTHRNNVPELPNINKSLALVLTYIEDNLSKPTLSAAGAAVELGFSERYIHMMFASSGTTFGAYATARRLDRVHADLASIGCGRTPISVVAYKWGFNDLSTFNRAFRRRFGCNPRAVRC